MTARFQWNWPLNTVDGELHNVVENTGNNIDRVVDQTPSAGTLALQGAAVDLSIGQQPPHPCL